MQDDINLLLEIIDKRIRKVLKEEHICYRYIAKVNGANTDTYAVNSKTPVTLLGFENTNVNYFTNRTAVTLSGGDMVYIDAIGNNLNSGVITGVFKYYTDLFIV